MTASILIVDDDKGYLSMLKNILAGWGHAVVGVEDGGDAIDKSGNTV